MNSSVREALLLIALLTGPLTLHPRVMAADAAPAKFDEQHRAFFQSYCVECHNEHKQEGKLRLDDISFEIGTVELADRWQKILNQLNAREMPPEDAKQPDEKAKADFLDALSHTLVAARKTIGDQGRVGVLRRLNRREYINTMRELFGIETDAEGLPDDKGTGAYDTMGSALFMSSNQLERYLAVARNVASSAIAEMRLVKNPPERKSVRTEAEIAWQKLWAGTINSHIESYMALRKWQQNGEKADMLPKGYSTVKDAKDALTLQPRRDLNWGYDYAARMLAMPMATQGAYLNFTYYWGGNNLPQIFISADAPLGKYTLRLRAATADQPTVPRFIELIYWDGGDRYKPHTVETKEIRTPLTKPEIVEFTVHLTPDSPRFFLIREKQFSDKEADHSKHLEEIFRGNGVGIRPSIWVDWTEWDGPMPNETVARRRLTLLGTDEPNGDDPAVVRSIIERFAERAFRGVAPKPSFIEKLVAVQQTRRKAGDDFLASLVEPLAVILASPRFLYLNEPLVTKTYVATKDESAPTSQTLSDLELASRLAYFLWASPPDDELIAAAKSGALRRPDMLSAQVDRMIADARSLHFATGFTHQWLSVDRLDLFQFDFRNFPKFDESTRVAARGEVYHTFRTLLTENLDARKLLKSDFVVINSVLADYYGITTDEKKRPITGMEFRKVMLPKDSPRGGLMGMACILAMGSNGVSTSPVERGAWVMRKLVNDPPPPAPANVPQLSRLAEKKLNARERLAAHQEQAQCAQCHRRIDPIGYGLENFDAAGLWREVDTFKPGEFLRRNSEGKLVVATYPIDPAGAFHRGPSFKNYFELRDLVAARGDDFLRGMIENLFEYALGRKLSFLDVDTINDLVAAAKRDGGLKSIVQRLVATEEFQLR